MQEDSCILGYTCSEMHLAMATDTRARSQGYTDWRNPLLKIAEIRCNPCPPWL
jgi:hypothetical protein